MTALLCGCTVFDASPESLLSPPKLTVVQTQIYSALSQVTGGSPQLVYPRSGDYRSAFVLHDLDEESSDEAIVFYRTKETSQNESGLRMNFLDRINGEWQSVLDKPMAGTEVESVAFSDFGTGTGIVVRTSVKGQTEQAVSVLRYADKGAKELYRSNYSFLETTDFDNNGEYELFLIGYDAAIRCYVAHLVQPMEELGGDMGDVSSIILSPDIAGNFTMSRQRLGDADNIIFLDFYKDASTYGSQLLRCANNNLTSISSDGMNRRVNSYTPNLTCTDIDGDGRLEIPTTVPLPGYENMNYPDRLYSVEWYYAEGEANITLVKKASSYISSGREYMFYIPVRWQGLVTASRSGSTVSFVKYDQQEPETLLSIYISADGSSPDGSWEEWGKSGNSTIFVNNSESEDPMVLTADELKSCLVIPES